MNHNSNNNDNIKHKGLSIIKVINSIISINNTYKRKANNNNVNQLNAKKIKYNNNTNNKKNNSILLNADNVLIPVILSKCLSYLQLKELNLIINRVNKYWANHTYNSITLANRWVSVHTEQCRLLSGYVNNDNNDPNNDNKQALNLLQQLKYASHIWLWEYLGANDEQLFLTIIKQARYVQDLEVRFGTDFNYLAITDESLRNVALDKLKSFSVSFYGQENGEESDYLLRELMKCIDLDKIKFIQLGNIPIKCKPLQIFENNPFKNLTELSLILNANVISNTCMNYLSGLTQLIKLDLRFASSASNPSLGNWSWIIKLINLKTVRISVHESTFNTFQMIIFSISDQTNCVKALSSLPKLTQLSMTQTKCLNGPNEFLELFSQFKCLTSLHIDGVDCKIHDLNLIIFPTISSLTSIRIETNDPASVIPILKSNPQINYLAVPYYPEPKVMIDILQTAPNVLHLYCWPRKIIDRIIICSEQYPFPLITSFCSGKTFINSNSRQQLIARIEQHSAPNYECPNADCNKQV